MRAENARSVVDGNAAAGMLAETTVELDEAAAIVRCRSCTHTLVTVLRTASGIRLVIGTLRELERR